MSGTLISRPRGLANARRKQRKRPRERETPLLFDAKVALKLAPGDRNPSSKTAGVT
mgnify:CR=1 FL=1